MPSISTFHAPYSRKVPDPVNKGITRHIFFVPANRVPMDVPNDPNPRKAFDDGNEIHYAVYRNVQSHLLEESGTPGTFHLKNKGITVICERVDRVSEGQFKVTFGSDHGILDGGTTYRIITGNQSKQDLPDDQYVKFEFLTGVDPEFFPELAEALNSSIQVKDKTMDDYKGRFDWIKDEIKGQPYEQKIAYSERDSRDCDIIDVLSILTCFNIFRYPNEDGSHPIQAYSAKQSILKLYEKNEDQFKKLRPILRDILLFHDLIQAKSKDIYNDATNGKYGLLGIVENRPRELTFRGGSVKHALLKGALFPILASFRFFC